MRAISFLWLTAVAAASGCGVVAGPDPASWMRASLSGSVTGSYSGSGDFWEVSIGGRRDFGVALIGRGASPGESFSILGRGSGRPAPGVYPLTALDQSDPYARGMTTIYVRDGDRTVEYYSSTSGHVEITRSSGQRVAGRFQFSATRYCVHDRMGSGGDPCGSPWAPPRNAPTITISGEFAAPRADDDVMALRPPVGTVPNP